MERTEFDVVVLPNGNTRMYVGEGHTGAPASEYSRLFRSDNVATGVPVSVVISRKRRMPSGLSWNHQAGPSFSAG
jgi:hypothetical protein